MAGKGRFVLCCHDLHRSNAEMMKQKKKLDSDSAFPITDLLVATPGSTTYLGCTDRRYQENLRIAGCLRTKKRARWMDV